MTEKPKPDHLRPYTGYRTKFMRLGKSKHEGERSVKRARLGNRKDRALYKSCKAHLQNPALYAQLCVVANRLVYNRDTVAVKTGAL